MFWHDMFICRTSDIFPHAFLHGDVSVTLTPFVNSRAKHTASQGEKDFVWKAMIPADLFHVR